MPRLQETEVIDAKTARETADAALNSFDWRHPVAKARQVIRREIESECRNGTTELTIPAWRLCPDTVFPCDYETAIREIERHIRLWLLPLGYRTQALNHCIQITW